MLQAYLPIEQKMFEQKTALIFFLLIYFVKSLKLQPLSEADLCKLLAIQILKNVDLMIF